MANKPTKNKKNVQPSRLATDRNVPQGKTKFYNSSDLNNKSTDTEDYDDTKRKGLKEWDEEYKEFDEGDLGADYGKP